MRRQAGVPARTSLGFRHLLAGILLTYVLTIAVPVQRIGAPLRVAILGVLLIAAVRTRRRAGTLSRPAFTLAVALTVGTLGVAMFTTGRTLTIVSQSATIILTAAAIAVLAQTLLAMDVVNNATVQGVLCIYLLLAMLFGSLQEVFANIVPHYLNGVGDPPTTSDTLYYSVITLTTVGYGDITPASNVARAIAATEALVGQLYLVSVVAAVVSRYQPTKKDT